MSSKKKKQSPLLVQCDACEAIVNEREVSLHVKYCPSFETNDGPAYVLNDSLHCHVDGFLKTDSSVSYLEANELCNVVLLSQAALQVCSIPIGDPVILSIGTSIKYVRKAWKSHDRSLLSAQLFVDDILLKMVSGKIVTISHLPAVLPCREIIVTSEDEEVNAKIIPYIQSTNSHKIFSIANEFNVWEYGRESSYTITDIIPFNGVCDINKFYKAMPDTIWKFAGNDNKQNNPCGLEIVGGMKDLIEEIEEVLKIMVRPKSQFPVFFRTQGILIHGLSGTGKSLLVKALATKWSAPPHQFRHVHLNSASATIEKDIEECFKLSESIAPSIVTIDDLDVICLKRKNIFDAEKHPSAVLATFFDTLNLNVKQPTMILATCIDVNKVDKNLRIPGRFGKEFEVCVPNPGERLEILKALLSSVPHKLDSTPLKTIADGAHGYVGADLFALVSRAVLLALRCDRDFLEASDLIRCLPLVKPSALREIMIQVPDVKWEDIGGQSELKHLLKQAIEWPLKYSESFSRLGITPPRGVLMYGPPGCSKTMIAKALATESQLNFISVKGPELFSKWVGESEKAVREVFRRARQSAPCIVFFDELDALAGERTGASGGGQVQERVLAQLLTELDGVEALGQVTIVGATNRPDRIDPALLRPGRLDRIVYVPLPDSQTRSEIFRVQFRKTPVSADVSIEELVEMTDGYSGAEVVAICHEAALKALNEDLNASIVTRDNFLSALTVITPRTPKSALEICEKYVHRIK